MKPSVPFHLSFLRILTVLYSSAFDTLFIECSHAWVTIQPFHVHWTFSYRVRRTRTLGILFFLASSAFGCTPHCAILVHFVGFFAVIPQPGWTLHVFFFWGWCASLFVASLLGFGCTYGDYN